MPAELSESFVNPFQETAFFNAKKELEIPPPPEPTPEPSPQPTPEPTLEPTLEPSRSVECPGGICKIPKERFFNKLKSKFGNNNNKKFKIIVMLVLLVLFGYFVFKKINTNGIKGIPNEL